MRHILCVSALLLLPAALSAQTPVAVRRAAQSITPEDIRRRIGIIADDSMRGRDTPSPELEKVAAYIASEFRRFGLKPGGDNGGFLQRYALDQVQIVAESSAAMIHGAGDATLSYGRDFVFINNWQESRDDAGELVLITGSLAEATSVDTAALAGKMLVLPGGWQTRLQRQRVLAWKPAAIVVGSAASDSQWAQSVAALGGAQLRDPSLATSRRPVVLAIRSSALQPILARLGAAAAAPAGGPPTARPLGAQLRLHRRVRVLEHQSAPNVVGILEGSDPQLKREYVILSAHMDHVGVAGPGGSGGCRAAGADSICNGADDDASGTIAVVEAAEAFAQLNPRPKRSLIFLTVSGEEKGLWGSAYFAEHPPVPITDIVADLNTDMVGRNWKDTIVAIGKEHSDLGATLTRVGAAHPELNMRPIDDLWPDQNFYGRSDHFNFARKGVPILFFFNGTHPDYHRPGDSPDKIDAEKESRIVKLVFYLGLEVANAAQRPKWNPDSYKRIVSGS